MVGGCERLRPQQEMETLQLSELMVNVHSYSPTKNLQHRSSKVMRAGQMLPTGAHVGV